MLHIQNSPCKSPEHFLVTNPTKWHSLIQEGCAGLSPTISRRDRGCVWLQGPMPIPAASHFQKGCSPEKKSRTLPGTIDFHPCSPSGHEVLISTCRMWAGMWLFKRNAICHGKPCDHFTLIILKGSPIGMARWVMKKRLNYGTTQTCLI